MDRCPANYRLLAWLPVDVASCYFLVSAVKKILLITVNQLDPEARALPGPTHGWLLTQSKSNDPAELFFQGPGGRPLRHLHRVQEDGV